VHKVMKRIVLQAFVAAAVLGAGVASAQAPTTTSGGAGAVLPENWAGGGSFYDLAGPTAVAIQIHVWGSLQRPGVYQIPRETRLSTLYTVAGGPTAGPTTPRQRQHTTIRLLRPNGNRYDEVFTTRFKNQPEPFTVDPLLQAGDILTVDTQVSESLHWREVLTTLSSVATFYILIDRVVTGRRR
jgi:hypothetical protein